MVNMHSVTVLLFKTLAQMKQKKQSSQIEKQQYASSSKLSNGMTTESFVDNAIKILMESGLTYEQANAMAQLTVILDKNRIS